MYPFCGSCHHNEEDAMSTPEGVERTVTPFESHRRRIQAYIRSMIRDGNEAEDLTQETFLRAHARRESLRDPDAAVG